MHLSAVGRTSSTIGIKIVAGLRFAPKASCSSLAVLLPVITGTPRFSATTDPPFQDLVSSFPSGFFCLHIFLRDRLTLCGASGRQASEARGELRTPLGRRHYREFARNDEYLASSTLKSPDISINTGSISKVEFVNRISYCNFDRRKTAS